MKLELRRYRMNKRKIKANLERQVADCRKGRHRTSISFMVETVPLLVPNLITTAVKHQKILPLGILKLSTLL